MSIPEHLWRYPTKEAIQSLARRLNLPYDSFMQDWQWEVADPNRIDEFLKTYKSGDLTDDERFTLMETILESFESFEGEFLTHPSWNQVLKLLGSNVDLHIYSVWYWSDLEAESNEDTWRIAPYMRKIFANHKSRFERNTSNLELKTSE